MLRRRLSGTTPAYEQFFAQLESDLPVRVPGTEVHLSSNPDHVPSALARNVEHNRVLHEQVVVTVLFDKQPFVRSDKWRTAAPRSMIMSECARRKSLQPSDDLKQANWMGRYVETSNRAENVPGLSKGLCIGPR